MTNEDIDTAVCREALFRGQTAYSTWMGVHLSHAKRAAASRRLPAAFLTRLCVVNIHLGVVYMADAAAAACETPYQMQVVQPLLAEILL